MGFSSSFRGRGAGRQEKTAQTGVDSPETDDS